MKCEHDVDAGGRIATCAAATVMEVYSHHVTDALPFPQNLTPMTIG